MISRRDAVRFTLGGLTGLAAGGGISLPAAAQAMKPLSALGVGNFNKAGDKVFSRSARIAVPSYRFGVVVRSGISATGSSGSTRVEASADLVGIDAAAMQQIAHQAFSDFIERLRATGRTVLGWNEITGSPAFAKLESTPAPFMKKPFADGRTVAMVSPPYLPLLNLHLHAPITDKSPFSLGNLRAINGLSADLKCLVLIPTIVLDFAALTGSGHKVYGGAANVGVQPGLYLVPLFTRFDWFHAKIALAGDGGNLILEDRIAVGQAGRLVQTSSQNNRAEIEEWNAYVRSMAWWNQPWASGPLRPTGAYDYSTYQYRVQPQDFSRACLDAARAANTTYLEVLHANRPA